MFACLLFYEFRVLNKNAKLKGENINTIPTLIGIVCYAGIVQFEFTKIKGARIILHVK